MVQQLQGLFWHCFVYICNTTYNAGAVYPQNGRPVAFSVLHPTPVQVVYPDRLPAIMQSPHPAVLPDGSMVNFSRVFPFGGSHVYRQDRVMLQRKEVRTVAQGFQGPVLQAGVLKPGVAVHCVAPHLPLL